MTRTGGLSEARLPRMARVMGGCVERGEAAGGVAPGSAYPRRSASARRPATAPVPAAAFAVPGRFGWDGGFGTSWSSDPHEDMVAILMVQRLFNPVVADLQGDFRTLAYQAIDD